MSNRLVKLDPIYLEETDEDKELFMEYLRNILLNKEDVDSPLKDEKRIRKKQKIKREGSLMHKHLWSIKNKIMRKE